ncbi:MarR family transcriptional regulator [Spirosoma taeanense]|uniref:MarR family transcriptional regulator n=1 Tax=Spirosoma taeanense TaxID=2735870 RepID=A0A6M5Y8U3_9BACT|nr:MarR family transcriptional regulator [Spirosoma taeanense]QJW90359.1 MarR family transcriptional regulator [Spirosoma taeanense]
MPLEKELDIQEKFSTRMGRLSIFMISHLGHLMAKMANRELIKAGFSLQIEQFPVLFIIYFSGDDLLSQQEIANMLQKDKSGIQRSIRTLERNGYLRIISDSIDRRKNLIQLTPAGKLAVDKAIATAEQIDKQVTSQLTADELTAFLSTMRKISTVLNK